MKQLFLFIISLVILSACQNSGRRPVDRIISELQNSTSNNVLVVAHRGDWRNAPENSIKAIENCIAMQVDIVEIDVRKTKDDKLVLMHDATIDRTTNGKGKVSDYTLDELQQFYLKDNQGGKNAAVSIYKIPTLEDALLAAKGKVMLNLDKSYGLLKEIAPLLKKTGTFDHVILKGGISAKQFLDDISFISEPIFFMPIYSDAQDSAFYKIVEHLELYNPVGFEFIMKKDSALMNQSEYIKNKGARIWVNTLWGSLCIGHTDAKSLENPDENWGWVINKGANIIQTDNPKELLDYLKMKGLRDF